MAATAMRLGSVDVKGGLWGADLLAAIADDRTRLPADTIRPDSYGLPARASTEQAARAAWTLLTAAWDEFTERHTARVERDSTDTYGDDRFTLTTWVTHLLTQLGYSPHENPPGGLVIADPESDTGDGDRFSITHLHAGQVPLHLLAAGVPLDTRTRGVAGAHRQSPHSLVQDYLNRTSKHLWAVLTNGLTLRVLRDNAALSRQAYIEFDLAAIFDDGAYADFALLWHAVHATRFTHDTDASPATCIAERWQDHATATGVAALDDLRDGVEAAIAEIGQGLVEHPANAALRAALDDPNDPFDAAALYRELLYVAYRHVFWFTLDDRDLLHPADADRTKVALYRDHYASKQLRTNARGHLGAHHPDGWQHFLTISSWFADPHGQPALDLPGLLGRLWEPIATSHSSGATLTNRRYYEALRRLAYVTRDGALQRINYDAMGSEELGAVYEALLEIRPTADVSQRKFSLARTSGSDRKKTGSYYTPTSLIKVLLDETLDPVLDDSIKQAVHDLPADATSHQRRHAQEAAVLATTVCDPAMGSAHFLVGAGMRIAKRLAQLRTEEVEPAPDAVQSAFRDVASRCLYGVDLNPMAVELAKVAIWLECHVPGQPLTFLDHHLKHGNALLGVGFDPDLMAWHRTAKKAEDQQGVPDAAFGTLVSDDRDHARALRDRNRARRSRGTSLRFHSTGAYPDEFDRLARDARLLGDLADNSPDALAAKQRAWANHEQDPELERQRLRADAWTASWTFTKSPAATTPLVAEDPLSDDDLPWDIYYDTFFAERIEPDRRGVRVVQAEAERLSFFHWHLEFPAIAGVGGFSVLLGNPPWEMNELTETEWFTGRDEEIASTNRKTQRSALIAALESSNDQDDRNLHGEWTLAQRDTSTFAAFISASGRYPYGGAGRLNLYAAFADHNVASVSKRGRTGFLAPSGLITDYTYRSFVRHLVDRERLRHVRSYRHIKDYFRGTNSTGQFVALVISGPSPSPVSLAFGLTPSDGGGVPYTLTHTQLATLRPNTRTIPAIRNRSDMHAVLKAHESQPPLRAEDGASGNPWRLKTRQGLFNMSTKSSLFVTRQELEGMGAREWGASWTNGDKSYRPLYEGKFIANYSHRAADYTGVPHEVRVSRKPTAKPFKDLENPDREIEARYWVAEEHVEQELHGLEFSDEAILCWSDMTRADIQRTCQAALIPRTAIGNSLYLAMPKSGLPVSLLLLATLNSIPFDYLAKQSVTGSHLQPYLLEQLPVPSPDAFESRTPWCQGTSLSYWIASRAAALSATTHWISEPLGYEHPVVWDSTKRRHWLSEIDAAMFILYTYSRRDVEYILDSFATLARKDRKDEQLDTDDPNWRTKRLVLAKYDELMRHAETGTAFVSPQATPTLPERLRTPGAVGPAGA